MSREMTETEIREFLAHGTRTAKLATVGRGGAPPFQPRLRSMIARTTASGSV
jgi:hypothetical protein